MEKLTVKQLKEAAKVAAQTSQTETPQTEEQKEALQVPTVQSEMAAAKETYLKGAKVNKSAYCKEVFRILGTTKETYNDHKTAIIAILEKENLQTATYNFIYNYFMEFLGTPFDKGTNNGQTVKAKSAEPQQTTEQQNTLKTLSTMFGVDSELYKQAEAQILADVENRKKEWAKEQIENDRKNKSVFVKNFVRSCNDVDFLNTLFDLCKEQEAKQATENAPQNDDDAAF